jgi:hypothetical protein
MISVGAKWIDEERQRHVNSLYIRWLAITSDNLRSVKAIFLSTFRIAGTATYSSRV